MVWSLMISCEYTKPLQNNKSIDNKDHLLSIVPPPSPWETNTYIKNSHAKMILAVQENVYIAMDDTQWKKEMAL